MVKKRRLKRIVRKNKILDIVRKKRGLKNEKAKVLKGITFLIFFSFIFGFLSIYSYSQINYTQNNGKIDNGLTNQKGVDVFLKIVGNQAPVILLDENDIYACEESYLDFPFLVYDIDSDEIEGSLDPSVIFYVLFPLRIDPQNTQFHLFSETLGKEEAGGVNAGSKKYSETIIMSDSHNIATKDINITVIEINNPPYIKNIGVKTVWIRGEGSNFHYQAYANDTEDGNYTSGRLGFNISFSPTHLFNISSDGTMDFIPNSSQIGTYNVTVCVNDSGLKNPHKNISLCKQDGKSLYTCDNFNLTVTDINRPPKIIDYYPENLSISFRDGENIYFNISSYDPDGTNVDVYWYVDGNLTKYDPGTNKSNFSYSYVCGFSGKSKVKVEITDGALNDSVEWNLTVANAACLPPHGGGGGGGGVACNPKWACSYWSTCQNTKEMYNLGNMSYKVQTLINQRCDLLKWNENFCGFQLRTCKDLNKCKNNLTMPGIMQECFYTKNPNCTDGIKNCHNGSCEVLTDCGGPCTACPTCTDKIKNQNEEDVDCGGVCSACKEVPIAKVNYFKSIMFYSLIFLIIAMIAITILGIRYIILKRKLGEISQVSIDSKNMSIYANNISTTPDDNLNNSQ